MGAVCATGVPEDRKPLAKEDAKLSNEEKGETYDSPTDAEVIERIEKEKQAEEVSPWKAGVIFVIFAFFVWMTIEAIYEVVRVLSNPDAEMSWFRRAAFQNTNAISSEVCMQEQTGSCPLFKPMGECTLTDPEIMKGAVQSLVIGHTVTKPNFAAKLIIDLIHVFGACSSYTLMFTVFLLGGPSYHGWFKKLVVTQLVAIPWEMTISGSLLAILRSPTDQGYPAINIYPSTSWQSVTYGNFSAWAEISRAGFLLAFCCGFINSGMAEATIFKVYPAKFVFVMHCLSCIGWATCLTTEFVQLFTLPVNNFRWSINFYDAFITSVYPMMDLPFMYALYYAWYKGKAWDWDMHRQFGLSCYALQTIFAIVYFMTCDKGIVFSTTVPVVWRVFINFLVIGPWAAMYYIPFLMKLPGLASAPEATREPEDWWDADKPKKKIEQQ